MKNFLNFSIKLSSLNRLTKQLILISCDLFFLYMSIYVSYCLKIGEVFIANYIFFDFWILILPLITIPIFIKLGLYRAVLKYIGKNTIIAVVKSITLSSIFIGFAMGFFREQSLSRSVLVIFWFISILSTIGTRVFAHWFIYDINRKFQNLIPILIYGAGAAGSTIANNILKSGKFKLEGFVDDDRRKEKMIINSTKVFSSRNISKLIQTRGIKLILLAIPSLNTKDRYVIIKRLSNLPVNVMELPSIEKIIDGKITFNDFKKIKVEDILGREFIKPKVELLNKNIKNKNVLVTGAGGSIGSELCRQIIKLKPNKIFLVDNSEFNLYKIYQEIKKEKLETVPILCSLQNNYEVKNIFAKYDLDTIYHAAAYKHVHLVEVNPSTAINNNIIGTYNIAFAAFKNNINNFVLISTDKAVRPINIMGATKRFAENLIKSINSLKENSTTFTIVRFGNVLDSAGSVVPLFRKQINQGGPVTVTHKNVCRYFMSIPEAVQLVIQSGALSKGGDIFILDMGKPVNILDLAEKMIRLSGLKPYYGESSNGDIEIQFIGLSPGEKLNEELNFDYNLILTEHPRIMKVEEDILDWRIIENAVQDFKTGLKTNNNLISILKKYIKDFKYE